MTDKIPLIDLGAQYRRYKDEFDAAIQGILDKTAFIGGPTVASFERAFAEYCGTAFAVGVGNGTDALYLGLRAQGLGAGDEVIVPANTFIATGEAVSMTGAKPVFVDVDDETALLDLSKVEAAITDDTKAIMPVHLYGQLVDMEPLLSLAKDKGLLVMEDAAQAHGARRHGTRAGAFAASGGFSFYPGKNLGAYGDAGAFVTSDEALADKVRRLANHGRSQKYGHEFEGVNSRLDGIQAAVLQVKLQHLDENTDERRAAARRYHELFADVDGVRVPKVEDFDAHVFHLYVIRVEDRDGLRKHLAADGISAGIHYPLPLHLQPAYAHLGHSEGDFAVTEQMAKEILSLPMYPELTGEQQERVVASIRAFVGK